MMGFEVKELFEAAKDKIEYALAILKQDGTIIKSYLHVKDDGKHTFDIPKGHWLHKIQCPQDFDKYGGLIQ